MRLIDADILERSLTEIDEHINMDIFTNEVRELIDNAPTIEAIPKANVYKAIQEMMKYEHEGFINISLARLDEILKKCGVSEDGNN